MGTSRQLPRSVESRKAALDNALAKKNNPGAAGNFLTTPTSDRLDAAQAAYTAGYQARNTARYSLHSATPTKQAAFAEARMYCRHFIMVFNLGIARGVYTAAQRSFFGIDVNDDAAPMVTTESDLLQVCNTIITGNVARLAAGGAPMANPTIGELQEKYDAFKNLHESYSNLKDALDTTQEAMDDLQEETDNVIKKVWDEVETFYNEEAIESKRANAREWGVVYVHTGATKTVVIQLAMEDGGELPPNLEVMLQDEPLPANDEGQAIYNTEMHGELTLQVNGDDIQPYNSIITVLPEGNQTFDVLLTRVG